jgi:hypothetical protein
VYTFFSLLHPTPPSLASTTPLPHGTCSALMFSDFVEEKREKRKTNKQANKQKNRISRR